MHSVSLLALRNRVRVQTDTENAQRPTDSQLNEMLNGSIRSLHAGLAGGASSLLLEADTVTILGGLSSFSLSANVWQLRSLSAVMPDGTIRDLERFETLERSNILNQKLTDGPWFYSLSSLFSGAPQVELLPPLETDTVIE